MQKSWASAQVEEDPVLSQSLRRSRHPPGRIQLSLTAWMIESLTRGWNLRDDQAYTKLMVPLSLTGWMLHS